MLIKEGFDDFLSKPVESSVLQRALKRHIPLEKQKSIQDYAKMPVADDVESNDLQLMTQASTESLSEKKAEPGDGAQKTSQGLVVGDLDVSKGVMYCGNQKNYIEILKSHRDGGQENMDQLQGLFEAEDWKNYIIVVHGIKSSMMSIGAVHLSEMAKALELAGKGENFDYIRAEHEAMMEEYRRVVVMLKTSPVLGAVQEEEALCDKPEIEEESFAGLLTDMENAMYELDDAKMKQVLDTLSAYAYRGKDLQKELQLVYKKVEMSDLMSAHETAVKLKEKLKKA